MPRVHACEALGEDEEAHPLDWLTEEFAWCPVCEMLFVQQPGTLVWVYDAWSVRLAREVVRLKGQLEMQRLGLTAAQLEGMEVGDGA